MFIEVIGTPEKHTWKPRLSASAPKRAALSLSLGFCLWSLLAACGGEVVHDPSTAAPGAQSFEAKGVVVSLDSSQGAVTVRHEAISNYMAAMTMPFHVKAARELAGLQPHDKISFRLLVTDTESWIENVKKLGSEPPEPPEQSKPAAAPAVAATRPSHPLLDYKFTNELGQAVSFNDFRGQALGITFFFTRCPLPEFCPRLSKNFCEASRQLSALAGGPTNWHFLSVSFDPEFDTPERLKAYGETYQYDPKHWSFLTGPTDKISELARLSGMEMKPEAGTITHNFRTLIVDAAGHLQTTIPVGGNLSDSIAKEMLKAAAVVPGSSADKKAMPVSGPSGAESRPGATVSSR